MLRVDQRFWGCAGLLVCLLNTATAFADRSEKEERQADRIAISFQRETISKLTALAGKYRGTNREIAILMKLLDVRQQYSDLEFRVAHGDADLKKTPIDLSKYEKSLGELIRAATHIIDKFHNHEEIARVYFSRASSYAELKQDTVAKQDFDYIADHFPKTAEAVRSNLWLAGFETEANHHRQAIAYLTRVEAVPEDSHYPFAIYQIAWAHYNLEEFPEALSYLKIYTEYYDRKAEATPDKTLSPAEEAFWEHGLKDVVVFFFAPFEKRRPGFGLGDALPLFRSFEKGPFLGKMLVSFALMLRSHERTEDLREWKDKIVEEEGGRPEALEVVLVNFEYLVLQEDLAKLVAAKADFRVLDKKAGGKKLKPEQYEAAVGRLLQAAAKVQKKISDEKDPETAQKLLPILRAAFEVCLGVMDSSDPKADQIHHNLAEVLFRVKDFTSATEEYRWVLNHWSPGSGLAKADIRLKILSSRYQELLAKNQIPKALSPRPLANEKFVNLESLDATVGEWIGWVDSYVKEIGLNSEAIENFAFESDRILYSAGQTGSAVARMLSFVKERPASKLALPAASLIIDTYVFNEEWESARNAAEDFLAIPSLGDSAFRERVGKVPVDASYKLLERAFREKRFATAVAMVEGYLAQYRESEHEPDCLFLGTRAAEALKDFAKAQSFLSELLVRFPKTSYREDALLSRGEIRAGMYDFVGAAADYEDYLSLAASSEAREKRNAILERIWYLNWLSPVPKAIDCHPYADDKKLAVSCDRYEALLSLAGVTATFTNAEVMKRAWDGVEENRGLWAAVGLRLGTKIAFKQRLRLAETFAEKWDKLDPLIQISLVSFVHHTLGDVFKDAREELPVHAKLRATADAISYRLELIRKMEKAAGTVVGLPWVQVKVEALSEMARVYFEFVEELSHVPAPKDISAEERRDYKKSVVEMTGPFEKKGKDILQQALNLAARFPIRSGSFAIGPETKTQSA